ncbi:MAG: AI-2E family transporter, partial [Planctomycetes bacterium]|nr:AI-2E family transporter [Planctomycetota bacterium]
MMDKLKQSMAASDRTESRWLTTTSLVILAGVALAFALAYTRPIMIPFVLALFIVTMVTPIMDFQMLVLRFPRVLAVTITLIVVILIIGLVGLLVTEVVGKVVATAPDYSKRMVALILNGYDEFVDWRETLLEERGEEVTEAEGVPPADVIEEAPEPLEFGVDKDGVLRYPPRPGSYVELAPTADGNLLVGLATQRDVNESVATPRDAN